MEQAVEDREREIYRVWFVSQARVHEEEDESKAKQYGPGQVLPALDDIEGRLLRAKLRGE